MATSEYPDTIWAGPPKAYGTGRDGKAVRLSVAHYTAGASGPGTARSGAAYDARRTDGTSCHVFHDSAESVQEVWTKDRSNSAFSKGNRLGIHHEYCATNQPRSWWLSGVGYATLLRGARAQAWDCKAYNLEPRRLTVAEVRAAWYSFPNGPRGICGHVDITRAFPEDGGTHTDPGDGFPWDVFISLVRQFLGQTAGTTSTPTTPTPTTAPEEEDTMRMVKAGGADGKVAYALVTGFEARVYRREDLGTTDTARDEAANLFCRLCGQTAAFDATGDAWNALMKQWGVAGHNFVRRADNQWVLEPVAAKA